MPTVQEAETLVEEICDLIDNDVPDGAFRRMPDYFEDVRSKALDIGDSVTSYGSATDRQIEALENMKAGVKKWIR